MVKKYQRSSHKMTFAYQAYCKCYGLDSQPEQSQSTSCKFQQPPKKVIIVIIIIKIIIKIIIIIIVANVFGQRVTAQGHHGLSCIRGFGRQARHGVINDVIYRTLTKAGFSTVKEPPGLIRSDSKRPDGITLIP